MSPKVEIAEMRVLDAVVADGGVTRAAVVVGRGPALGTAPAANAPLEPLAGIGSDR